MSTETVKKVASTEAREVLNNEIFPNTGEHQEDFHIFRDILNRIFTWQIENRLPDVTDEEFSEYKIWLSHIKDDEMIRIALDKEIGAIFAVSFDGEYYRMFSKPLEGDYNVIKSNYLDAVALSEDGEFDINLDVV